MPATPLFSAQAPGRGIENLNNINSYKQLHWKDTPEKVILLESQWAQCQEPGS